MDDNVRRELAQKAEEGDFYAASTLGDYYRHMEETEENSAMAHYYYWMAADWGYAPAKFQVGLDYYSGCGVEENEEKAVKYIMSAADEGFANAQHLLGLFYKNGQISTWSGISKAFTYFEKAAKQGHAKAQVELADIYMFEKEEFRGIFEGKIDNAIFWWACAYAHGKEEQEASETAQNRLNHLIESGVPGGADRVNRIMGLVKKGEYSKYRSNPD